MTITSVRLMFVSENRATPCVLHGYFLNIFNDQNLTFSEHFPIPAKPHGLYEKIQGTYFKIRAIYFKICALYFKTNGLYFSPFLIH